MKNMNALEDFFRHFEEMNVFFDSIVKEVVDVPKEINYQKLDEERKPYTEVIIDKKGNEAIITFEMPGIEKKDIELFSTEEELEVQATTKERKYKKHIPLEVKIVPKTAKARYNNGVLEIKVKLKDNSKDKKKIKVEKGKNK